MQKFIITLDGELRFGDVRLHKDLIPHGDYSCHGGGFWTVEKDRSVSLYGSSFDFGQADFSMLRSVNLTGISCNPKVIIYYPYYPDLRNPEFVREYHDSDR